MIKSSNSFVKNYEYDEEFLRLSRLVESGLDCSEMVEDFHSKFGGRAVLLLSKDWNKGKKSKFVSIDGEEKEFHYHYAWEKDGLIYDPMLGYEGVNYENYLRNVIGNGDVVITGFVDTFPLKTYLP